MAPVHPDDYERVATGLLGVLRDGGTYHDRYRVFTATGEHALVEQPGHADASTSSGAITGIIGSLEDVTELVAAQEQNTPAGRDRRDGQRPGRASPTATPAGSST